MESASTDPKLEPPPLAPGPGAPVWDDMWDDQLDPGGQPRSHPYKLRGSHGVLCRKSWAVHLPVFTKVGHPKGGVGDTSASAVALMISSTESCTFTQVIS